MAGNYLSSCGRHAISGLLLYCAVVTQIQAVYTMSTNPDSAPENHVGNLDDLGDFHEFRQNQCQDRHGYVEVTRFHHRSCAMCYVYLFQGNRDLVGMLPYGEQLSPKNMSEYGMGPITPDPANDTAMELVCATLHEDECRRWRDCCQAAVSCCKEQRETPFPMSDGDVCLRTWDGYSCWGDTRPGSKATLTCPSFMEHVFDNRQSQKECTNNATWVKKQDFEWTDYTSCVDIEGVLVNVYLCVSCNAASILLVLPSIIIFFVFKDLSKQHRIRLHINFFMALLLRSVTVILWFMLVHYEKVVNNHGTAVMMRNPVWCRVLSFFKIYLNSATYAWMFCEGYYLHRLISRAFEPPKTLITLYVFGWGFPILSAVLYSILRVVYKNDSCWINNLGHLEWVLYAPNLLCLVLNIAFLLNILRILMFQLHSHPHEPSNFRRGLKAGFMLIPLFGVQLILTIYRPGGALAGYIKAYENTTMIVINSQGIFVSLVFCFFNGEVLAHFYDHCTCCQGCLKHCVRIRGSASSGPMTQVTNFDDRRSPSIHSHSSISPKRNGRYIVNGYNKEVIDLQELNLVRKSSQASLGKQNGGSPTKKVAYSPVPTEQQ